MAAFLDQSLETACKDGSLPGAVVLGANSNGIFYSNAFGVEALASNVPLKVDAMMWIASCTKLLTTIAALQCVERGLVKLEDDITLLLPDLAKVKILTAIDDAGQPIFKSRTNPITLSNLLTHSAGFSYPDLNPTLQKYVASVGKQTEWNLPLVYEPGTSWLYSPSIDWAGKLVEALTGKNLEAYFQDHIYKPLGIHDTTFFLDARPGLKARMMGMTVRGPEGQLVNSETPHEEPSECFGGHGLYSTVPDYTRVLQSLLANDEKLVSKKTREIMFQGHLGPEPRAALQPISWALLGNPQELQVDWGFGGLISLQDLPDRERKAGTMTWGGMPNVLWFIDPAAGVCGVFGTQVLPPTDQKARDLAILSEKALHETAKA